MKYALLSVCSVRAWYSLWILPSVLISSSWEFWMMRYTFTRLSLESLITQRMCGWACLSQKNSAPPPTKGSTYVSISEKLPGNDSVRTGSSLLFPPTHGKQGFPAGLLFFFFSVIKLKLNGYQMSDCPKQSYSYYICYSSSVSSRCCSFGSFLMRRSSRRMISPTSSLMR